MGDIWTLVFLQPLANGLIALYSLTENLGVAIILFTIFVRLILLPLSLPSMRTMNRMRELAPHLERIKQRHKDDKTKLAQAQMDLYKEHGVNPAAGCLPQIIQIVLIIAFYQMFYRVLPTQGSFSVEKVNELLYPALQLPQNAILNTQFLYFDLTKLDVFNFSAIPFPLPGLLLLLSAFVQLLSSKIMMPEVKKAEDVAKKTPQSADNMAASMQETMLWMFPLSTLFIGFIFPSGVVLMWFVFSLFQLVQQYFISGWGGLAPWLRKAGLVKYKHE